MLLIIIGLAAIFVLIALRVIKVKSFAANLLIDGCILTITLIIVMARRFAVGMTVCWGILVLWIVIGTLARRYYSAFDLWFTNKLCKIFKLPQYTSIADLDKDANHADRLSIALYYYAIEALICILIAFIGFGY